MLGTLIMSCENLMSVYTLLSLQDIQPFVESYGLAPAVTLTPIKGGIENSNYFLTLADGCDLVLTLFEELGEREAAFLSPLLTHLHDAGIAVAAPLTDRRAQALNHLAGKPAQLAPRLAGSHPYTPGLAQCRAMGAALASLHIALRGYPLQRENTHGQAWWEAVAKRWLPKLPPAERSLLNNLLARYAQTLTERPALPMGLIHGDLFRDNTLMRDDTVTAILDFSETSHDYWLLDIAITVNDFCRHWSQNGPSDGAGDHNGEAPDTTRRTAFLQGYESRRPLSADEKSALPVFLAVAAMRFWLSRLDVGARNAAEGRSGEHVLEKDPAEMRELCAQLMQES
jgi:homoserine kinase type II